MMLQRRVSEFKFNVTPTASHMEKGPQPVLPKTYDRDGFCAINVCL